MSGRNAGLVLVGVCVVIVILLLAGIITPLVGGVIFAAALVVLGVASRGFRTK